MTQLPSTTDQVTGAYSIALFFSVLVLGFPTLILVAWVVLWLVPLTAATQRCLSSKIGLFLWSFAGIEVLFMATFAGVLEINQIVDWILNHTFEDWCGDAPVSLSSICSFITPLPDSTVLLVKPTFQEGAYWLLAEIIIMYIVHVGTMFHTHKLLGDGQGGGDKSVKEAGRSTTTRTRGVLLPHQWKGENVTGWWMSEKLDGIRAYWDGLQLLSRNGAKLSAPTWFTEGLPTDLHLDGELIGDHNEYQATSKIVQSFAGGDEQWQKLTYEVFDAPSLDIPFEKRLERVRGQAEKKQNAYLRVVQHTRCKGQEHLEAELERMSKDGAKGLMLRKPHSKYVRSRSKTLLKVKITFLEREAIVVGYNKESTCEYYGQAGSLHARLDNGIQFSVWNDLSHQQRCSPLTIGSIVTVKFSGYTKDGKPRFPRIVGVRVGAAKNDKFAE
mmetsp:Transcript_30385/g.49536  ORF Transcript_30385/g.49536 Transcript_30385/m.49536 type:complete len:442 (+) Transcript_30385:883-2208(+)